MKLIEYIKTRTHIGWVLVFCFSLAACKGVKQDKAVIGIVWEDGRAVALAIPLRLLESVPADSVTKWVQVRLEKHSTSILGEYTRNDTAVVFHPVISFTPGLKYELWIEKELVEEFRTPSLYNGEAPYVANVYPSGDTLPVNILKIHICFSKPMQEGQALRKMVLIKNNRDTVSSAFLELQEELWNKERNILTIWFDPGRIKRDLQPNITMGPPLDENANYSLIINKDWQDTHGMPLTADFRWEFVTGARDNTSPDISRWQLNMPASATGNPLIVDAGESLDYVLLTNTIRVIDERGSVIAGKMVIGDNEKGFSFVPSQSWKPGEYTLQVEARLEDLAGNNLNHPFDNDLLKKQQDVATTLYTTPFRVK